MKRIIPVLLVMLLLGGCVRMPEPPAEPEQTKEIEAAVETSTGTVIPEKEPDEMKKQSVTLDGLDSYLRLELPEGWTWAAEEPAFADRSILLTAPTDDGFQIRMACWESFGMCGTSVTMEEKTLPNGLTVTIATEKSADGILWKTVILPPHSEQFTLQFCASQSVLDEHQAELDAMLESLQLGALSHIPPQPSTPLADK